MMYLPNIKKIYIRECPLIKIDFFIFGLQVHFLIILNNNIYSKNLNLLW